MTQQKSANRWGSNTRRLQQESGRRIILAAAIECLQSKGSSTTIDDIASAANITRRTVYHYFKSKTAIWRAAAIQHACDQVRGLNAAVTTEQDFPDYVTACAVHMIESLPNQPFNTLQTSGDMSLKIGHVYFTSGEVRTAWIDTFQTPYIEALRRGSINPELTLDELIAWFGRVILSYVQYPEAEQSADELRTTLNKFFSNALRYGAGAQT
jgi:AcrR family transcriptional regulator